MLNIARSLRRLHRFVLADCVNVTAPTVAALQALAGLRHLYLASYVSDDAGDAGSYSYGYGYEGSASGSAPAAAAPRLVRVRSGDYACSVLSCRESGELDFTLDSDAHLM